MVAVTNKCPAAPMNAQAGPSSAPNGNSHTGKNSEYPIPERTQSLIENNPVAVREARLWMIREELYGDFDEIRIYAERGLRALEVENDLDFGRAFDSAVKHLVAVAEYLKELIALRMGPRQ